MKNLIYSIKTIGILVLMLSCFSSIAQSGNLVIENRTDCYFEFVIDVADCAGSGGCVIGPICVVPPGTSVVRPCGLSKLEWHSADVVSVDQNCEDCGGSSSTVQRMLSGGCSSTMSPTFLACDPCGYVNVSFTSPNHIVIQ